MKIEKKKLDLRESQDSLEQMLKTLRPYLPEASDPKPPEEKSQWEISFGSDICANHKVLDREPTRDVVVSPAGY